LTTGCYNVLITDSNDCEEKLCCQVYEKLKIDCCKVGNNTAEIFVSGGISPYVYSWVDEFDAQPIGGTTEKVTELVPGSTVTVTVIDDGGNNSSQSSRVSKEIINFINPENLKIVKQEGKHFVSAVGAHDGSFWFNVIGIDLKHTTVITDQNDRVVMVCDDCENCSKHVDGNEVFPPYYECVISNNNIVQYFLTGLASGFYKISISDPNGNIKSTCFAIFDPDSHLTILTKSEKLLTSFPGAEDGFFEFCITGGAKPYKTVNIIKNTVPVVVNPHADKEGYYRVDDLSRGCYAVIVTDKNDRTASILFSVQDPKELIFNTILNSPFSCKSVDTGIIQIKASGGVPPYQYSLNSTSGPTGCTGSTWQDRYFFTNLKLDNYVICVKDSACVNQIVSKEEHLSTFTLVHIVPICTNVKGISCTGLSDGEISLGIAGGKVSCFPSSFRLTLYETETKDLIKTIVDSDGRHIRIDNLEKGIYTLVIEDNQSDENYTITYAISDSLEMSVNLTTRQHPGVLIAELTNFNSQSSFTYNWSNGSVTNDIGILTNVEPGYHTVTVIDNSSGCQVVSNEILVTISDELKVNAIVHNCGNVAIQDRLCNELYNILDLDETEKYFDEETIFISPCSGRKETKIIQILETFLKNQGGAFASLEITGGDPSTYEINWNSSQSGSEKLALEERGEYTAFVNDSLGNADKVCFDFEPYEVDVILSKDCKNTLKAIVSGGQEPFYFEWYKNGKKIKNSNVNLLKKK